jgi:hypothetical protein
MTNELDLTLLPLYRVGGQEISTLPGLMALTPPRRASRGRERDRLLLYLSLSGNTPLNAAEHSQLVAQTATAFYQTSGSLTFALKTAAELVNTTLVDRNMRTTGRGQYVMGTLILAAMRANQLYIVQSGPTHAFYISPANRQHFHDPQLAGRGLGFSQNAYLYFSHVEVAPGDRLVFAAQMPDTWGAVIEGESSHTLDSLRHRLMAALDANLSAVLIGATAGSGQVVIQRPAAAEESRPPAPVTSEIAPPVPSIDATQETANEPEPVAAELERPVVPPSSPLQRPNPAVSTPVPASPVAATSSVLPRHAPSRKVVTPPAGKDRQRSVFRTLAKSVTSMRLFGRKASTGAQSMATRILPSDEDQQPFRVSSGTMALIAIIVPLVIVVMAAVVYYQFGRSSQYQTAYASAEQAAVQAVSESDPAKQRTAWENTLYYLDQAEKYLSTDQSKALRQQAQNSLDSIEKISRVSFLPAFDGGLGNIQVTQMVSNENDLYLLNAGTGSIMRALKTNKGFALDTNFNSTCVPGNYEGIQVGMLVDIVALDKNDYNATVMGVDAVGNTIFCRPDDKPRVEPLASPDTGWGTITAITFDANTLYVLDASRRAVWVYDAIEGSFPDRPRYFFSDQIPTLETTIDIAVSGNDLYLLHNDGHLTTCIYSPLVVSDTRCTEYAEFIDKRPGRQSGPKLADATFTQMQFTPAPSSTVAFLEPATQAVFRFAPRSLEMQDQIRDAPGSNSPLPPGQPVSAMTLSQNRILYLFINGQVYYAENVP